MAAPSNVPEMISPPQISHYYKPFPSQDANEQLSGETPVVDDNDKQDDQNYWVDVDEVSCINLYCGLGASDDVAPKVKTFVRTAFHNEIFYTGEETMRIPHDMYEILNGFSQLHPEVYIARYQDLETVSYEEYCDDFNKNEARAFRGKKNEAEYMVNKLKCQDFKLPPGYRYTASDTAWEALLNQPYYLHYIHRSMSLPPGALVLDSTNYEEYCKDFDEDQGNSASPARNMSEDEHTHVMSNFQCILLPRSHADALNEVWRTYLPNMTRPSTNPGAVHGDTGLQEGDSHLSDTRPQIPETVKLGAWQERHDVGTHDGEVGMTNDNDTGRRSNKSKARDTSESATITQKTFTNTSRMGVSIGSTLVRHGPYEQEYNYDNFEYGNNDQSHLSSRDPYANHPANAPVFVPSPPPFVPSVSDKVVEALRRRLDDLSQNNGSDQGR